MLRACHMLLIDLRAVGHRLRHDFGKELAVLAASLILLATFIYVFNDFLNVQIAEVSATVRERIAALISVATLSSAVIGAARNVVKDLNNQASCRAMAQALGETSQVIAWYDAGRSLTIVLIWGLTAWLVTHRFLMPMTSITLNVAFVLTLLTSTGWCYYRARQRGPGNHTTTIPDVAKNAHQSRIELSRAHALLQWRLTQHFYRNRAHQIIYGMASMIVLSGGVAYAGGAPFLAPILAALIAGMLIACILAMALAADLQHTWIEHALGIAHDDIVACYAQLARRLALPLALLMLLLCLAASPATWSTAWKPAAILLVTPLFAPYMLFQIDARRPGINIIALIIVGLFLGTAIFAHGLALVLPLIAKASLADNQSNRFHRA